MHPKSDVRFYIPRKDGGSGLTTTEDCVEMAVSGLYLNIHGSEERLIQAARGYKLEHLKVARALKKVKKEKNLQV